MGYRSNVRIITSKRGYKELEKFSKKYLEQYKNYGFDMLNHCEVMYENNISKYLGWNYVKWYDGEPAIDAIMKDLDYLEKNDFSYRYARMGEQYDDYEEQNYDSRKRENFYLEYPYFYRGFDDEEVTQKMSQQEYNLNNEKVNIKKIYSKIDKERLKELDIKSLDDFKTYIATTIASNISYDFGIDVNYKEFINLDKDNKTKSRDIER